MTTPENETPPNVPVLMVRDNLHDLPRFPLPSGFTIRAMTGPDEAPLWTAVQHDAERFFPIADDLFARQFGNDPEGIAARCYLVVEEVTGAAVGTISAWYGDGEGAARPEMARFGRDWGRIHWVAVRPAFQGRGLARAALAFILQHLVELGHEAAYLETSTGRLAAIKLYLDAGFTPDLTPEGAREAWQSVATRLPHPLLTGL